jgi:UDP-glucose 4-epimerase
MATKLQSIALTGATGFIGRHLARELPKRGYRVRILLRKPSAIPIDCTSAVIGDLSRLHITNDAFAGIDAVVHTAGIAHAMSGVPEDDYRSLNTDATVALARSALAHGVKRFVFLSSVRAQSGPWSRTVLTEDDEPQPTDAYGRSKLAAEQGLATLTMDWVALRLPLTYGSGVKGNLARLTRLGASAYPLPFGLLKARRSVLSVQNLLSALECILNIEHRLQIPLLVADPEPVSVSEMIAIFRRAQDRSPGLIPVPLPLLRAALTTLGRTEEYQRLSEPLVVSPAKLASLGWHPLLHTDEGLIELARGLNREADFNK